ncbi:MULTISPECIES: hypothetical protein [unclassified Halomonas]|uniref:hypothetical protein n=1 Tax=unclassified Halomonas TaxID=2609666 RepID=UPI00209FEEC9|nr:MULTISPECIES: hypothetical protein [unclassified Halomonas]MCP1314393.1 hypothetical protein [Halomonas sp. 707D7]MCP1326052.1 hypothetical protein [Halomonas sp. 707D4]
MAALFLVFSLASSYSCADDLDRVLPGNEMDHVIRSSFEGFGYKYDPFEKGVDFYSIPNGGSSLGLVGNIDEDGITHLILMVNYVGEGWIYADRVQILTDGDVWSKDDAQYQRNVMVGSTVLESLLIPFTDEVEALLDRMYLADDPVMIRVSGRGSEDFVASEETIERFYKLKEALKLL